MQLSELPELLKHQVIEGAGCQLYALGQRDFEGRKGTSDTQQGGSEPGAQQRGFGLLKLLLFRGKGLDTVY